MAQSVRDALLRLHAPPAPPTQHSQAAPRRSERLKSKLLRLPRELRDQIYRLVVVVERLIPLFHGHYHSVVPPACLGPPGVGRPHIPGGVQWRWDHLPPQPKLAWTCRQIYHEALPIYYSENIFDIGNQNVNRRDHILRLLSWRKSIRRHVAHLSSIQATQHYGRDILRAHVKTHGPLYFELLNYSSTSQQVLCCPCRIDKIWRATNKKKPSGVRLLEFIRVYFETFQTGLLGAKCPDCNLEVRRCALH